MADAGTSSAIPSRKNLPVERKELYIPQLEELSQGMPLSFTMMVLLMMMTMAGSSCPKIREGCRPAGGCEGRCAVKADAF